VKKYSSANLLEDELSSIGVSDFLNKLLYKLNKNSSVLLNINIPLNLYLRVEIFCEDIQDLSEIAFNQNDLMNLLYEDFLLFAKKNPNPKAVFKLLTSLDHVGGKECSLEPQGESIFKLVHIEQRQSMQKLQIKMKRKLALRGEVLLADIEEVQPEHGYTLERVLELLYIDFIDKFRKGDNETAINNILSLLSDEE